MLPRLRHPPHSWVLFSYNIHPIITRIQLSCISPASFLASLKIGRHHYHTDGNTLQAVVVVFPSSIARGRCLQEGRCFHTLSGGGGMRMHASGMLMGGPGSGRKKKKVVVEVKDDDMGGVKVGGDGYSGSERSSEGAEEGRGESLVGKKRKRKSKATTTTDPIQTPASPPNASSSTLLQSTSTNPIWPTSLAALTNARSFLHRVISSSKTTLLLPDRDTDGLCAGTILSTTLRALGKPPSLMHVHFLPRGENLFSPASREEIARICVEKEVRDVIVLDQGSRGDRILPPPSSSPLSSPRRSKKRSRDGKIGMLIIDHHNPTTGFPPESTAVLSAHGHEPVATTSMLTYILCQPLLPSHIASGIEWLAVAGTYGDLGAPSGWLPEIPEPWGEMLRGGDGKGSVKRSGGVGKLGKLAALVNAPRRTPESSSGGDSGVEEVVGTVRDAWDILQFDPLTAPERWTNPAKILSGEGGESGKSPGGMVLLKRLEAAQLAIREEMQKWNNVAPLFTRDDRMGVLEIHSGYQIHPVIATKWANILGGKKRSPSSTPSSSKLLAVACVNTGYIPGKVNFSIRVCASKRASGDGEPVDLIKLLEEYASQMEVRINHNPTNVDEIPPLHSGKWKRDLLGPDFARGHKEATGGSLETSVWEMFRKFGLDVVGKEERKREREAEKERREKEKEMEKKEKEKQGGSTLDKWVKSAGKPTAMRKKTEEQKGED